MGTREAEPGREFTIPTSSLKHADEPMHRLIESIERLMQTVVVAKAADGAEMRLQLQHG